MRTIIEYILSTIVVVIIAILEMVVGVFMIILMGSVWRWVKTPNIKNYLAKLFYSIDQFFNALLFGNEDETISSRLGRNKEKCKFCQLLCWILDFIEKDHCKKAMENEQIKRIKNNKK